MDSNSRDVIFTKFVDGSSRRSFIPTVLLRNGPSAFPDGTLLPGNGPGNTTRSKNIEQLLQAGTKFTLAMRTTPWFKEAIIRCHKAMELPRHWSVAHELHGMKGRYVAVKYDIGNGVAKEKCVNVMAYRNSAQATVEINLLLQNLGKFMTAENNGKRVSESLWRTVRPFVSCNTWNHEDAAGWSFNQDAIDRYKKTAGGFTLLKTCTTSLLYHQRNVIEMGFDWLKNEVKGSGFSFRKRRSRECCLQGFLIRCCVRPYTTWS